MLHRLLDNQYNISPGTAGVFNGPYADPSKWQPILYVNIRTLYRNFIASLDLKQPQSVSDNEFIETFLNEVTEFERLVKELTDNRVATLFYYPEYKEIDKRLPHLKRKQYNPSIYDEVEENMWSKLQQEQRFLPINVEFIGEEGFPSNYLDITMLTSFAVDLLEAPKFNTITLLESFTGKLKKRQEWYTKLNLPKSNDYEYRVPFNKFTLQVFGDKSGFYQRPDIQMRRFVSQMAKEDNWLPIATIERLKASIRKVKGYELKEKLYSYF